jgi:hypothetical protein
MTPRKWTREAFADCVLAHLTIGAIALVMGWILS